MRSFVAIVCLCALGTCGCSPSATLTPVEGVVTINGAPTANLLIQFHPVDSSLLSASAVSDADGRFKLVASSGKPGAPLGSYKVTVADNSLATDDEPDGKQKKAPINRVPTTYLSVTTTPLEVTVDTATKEYRLGVTTTK